MADARARGDRGRRARLHDVAHAQPPHEPGRAHADAHRRGRRAGRHRARDRRDRPGRAAGRLRLRRRRRRVRDLPAHGRGVGPAAVVLARAGARRRLAPPARAARGRERRRRRDDRPGRAARRSGSCSAWSARCTRSSRTPSTARSRRCRSPSGSRSWPTRSSRRGSSRPTPSQRDDSQARRARCIHAFDRMFELGDPPDYEPDPATSIAAARRARGPRARSTSRTTCCSRDGGRSFLYLPSLNYADGNLDAVGEMLAHPNTVVGLGDGGAHVGTICDASFPTTLLTLWARDRDARPARPAVRGAAPHERHRPHRRPARPRRARARLPRRRQRHRLRAPHRAPARRCVHDLPAGGKRLVQAADGYVATLVAGEVTYENGEACGPLPGRLVRGPQPAPTNGATRDERDPTLTPLETGVRVAHATSSATATCSSSPTRTSTSSTPRCAHAEATLRRRARHHPRVVPAPDARRRARRHRRASSSTGAASCSSAACPSSATARSGRRRSTGASACTSAGRGRRTRRAICSATSPTRARAADDPTSRGNEIGGIAFPFHSDGSDLVGLFCLDAGASGGASLVANVVTIHNELVRTEPELAAELYAPFPYDLRGEQAPGAKPLVHDADLQPARRPAVRALHPPVHRVDSPPRRRAPPVGRARARRWTGSTRCAPTRSTTCR